MDETVRAVVVAAPVTAPGAHRRRWARTGCAGVLAAATLLTSACAAGQHAQTAVEKNSIDGANQSVGSMDIRAASFKAPLNLPYYMAGADAEFNVVIVNGGRTNDSLTSISSPSATGGWGSYNTQKDGYAVQAADSDAATQAAAGSPSASASTPAAASSGASASASPSASLPAAGASVPITAGNRVSYGTPDSAKVLLLRGLRDKLYAGNTIQVTFTFARAGSVTVAVPVQLTESPEPATVEPSGSASVPA